jgi:peptidoglycan hydrolase CwlO-like protein
MKNEIRILRNVHLGLDGEMTIAVDRISEIFELVQKAQEAGASATTFVQNQTVLDAKIADIEAKINRLAAALEEKEKENKSLKEEMGRMQDELENVKEREYRIVEVHWQIKGRAQRTGEEPRNQRQGEARGGR